MTLTRRMAHATTELHKKISGSRKFDTFSVDIVDTFSVTCQFDTFSVDKFDTFSGPTFDTFSVDLTHLAALTHLS